MSDENEPKGARVVERGTHAARVLSLVGLSYSYLVPTDGGDPYAVIVEGFDDGTGVAVRPEDAAKAIEFTLGSAMLGSRGRALLEACTAAAEGSPEQLRDLLAGPEAPEEE